MPEQLAPMWFGDFLISRTSDWEWLQREREGHAWSRRDVIVSLKYGALAGAMEGIKEVVGEHTTLGIIYGEYQPPYDSERVQAVRCLHRPDILRYRILMPVVTQKLICFPGPWSIWGRNWESRRLIMNIPTISSRRWKKKMMEHSTIRNNRKK